jgi:hypothetical protein
VGVHGSEVECVRMGGGVVGCVRMEVVVRSVWRGGRSLPSGMFHINESALIEFLKAKGIEQSRGVSTASTFILNFVSRATPQLGDTSPDPPSGISMTVLLRALDMILDATVASDAQTRLVSLITAAIHGHVHIGRHFDLFRGLSLEPQIPAWMWQRLCRVNYPLLHSNLVKRIVPHLRWQLPIPIYLLSTAVWDTAALSSTTIDVLLQLHPAVLEAAMCNDDNDWRRFAHALTTQHQWFCEFIRHLQKHSQLSPSAVYHVCIILCTMMSLVPPGRTLCSAREVAQGFCLLSNIGNQPDAVVIVFRNQTAAWAASFYGDDETAAASLWKLAVEALSTRLSEGGVPALVDACVPHGNPVVSGEPVNNQRLAALVRSRMQVISVSVNTTDFLLRISSCASLHALEENVAVHGNVDALLSQCPDISSMQCLLQLLTDNREMVALCVPVLYPSSFHQRFMESSLTEMVLWVLTLLSTDSAMLLLMQAVRFISTTPNLIGSLFFGTSLIDLSQLQRWTNPTDLPPFVLLTCAFNASRLSADALARDGDDDAAMCGSDGDSGDDTADEVGSAFTGTHVPTAEQYVQGLLQQLRVQSQECTYRLLRRMAYGRQMYYFRKQRVRDRTQTSQHSFISVY